MVNQSYFYSRFSFQKERENVWKVLTRYLQKDIPVSSKILELGCGYCDFINNIIALEKHAIDLFEGIKDYAHPDVYLHFQSATEMSNFSDESFDVVFASNFFEHLGLDEFEKTIKHVVRILKKGGKLIIIQPNFKYAYKEYFDDFTHRLIFTEVSLSDFLKSQGLKIKRVIPKFIPFSMKSKLPKWTFLIKIYLYLPIKPFARQMLIIAEKS
ncbi:MAG: class I SAM-dependent methyltransferase [bacterium]